jgi:transposase
MGCMEFITRLLPGEGVLGLQGVAIAPDSQPVIVRLRSEQAEVKCPVWDQTSQRQHSQSVRSVQDLPWATFRGVIQLAVGRWLCQNPACERRIFTERLPGVVKSWGRRTERRAEVQTHLGLTLGGRAGVFWSGLVHSRASKDSLIRLVRRQPLAEPATPRVLGLDDWANRRGQRSGTRRVDLERQPVVAVLPERSAAGVEQWLKAQPGLDVISRARAAE